MGRLRKLRERVTMPLGVIHSMEALKKTHEFLVRNYFISDCPANHI